ncbi:Chaperonin 60 subunit beta 4, chloroplastic [Linum perenne]
MASTSPSPISATSFDKPKLPRRRVPWSSPPPPSSVPNRIAMSKELHFNRDGSTTKKLLAGVELVAELVGVTLGPKGRNVVLQNKYGPPKIVNDGETVLKQIELEDPLENVGVKLVRQAGAKTNDLAAGMNPIQIARGIEKTSIALVSELRSMSREVEDNELADVAAVSAGNDYEVGNMIADALRQVGKKVKEKYPIVIIAENVEQEALAPVIMNKLKGALKAAAVKAPAFGVLKSHYLDDIAVLTGGTVIRDDAGLTLEKAGKEVLGTATKVLITKDSTLIVTDGSNQAAVDTRVSQLRNLVENTVEKSDKKTLNERIARLSGGIAILQVGAQTQVELKDKQLRIEDALNATKAAIEEGVVVGGGCSLLRLAAKVDSIKEHLDNEEQKIGAEIFRRALSYPIRLIAKNAGKNGNVVINQVLSNDDPRYGYNAANDRYEDLITAGIMDPTKQVVRCCLEHSASVAKTFLTSDAVVVDVTERRPLPRTMPAPMPPSPMNPPVPGRKRSGLGPLRI